MERLQKVIRNAAEGQPATLLLLDVDNLKSVNDCLGHSGGDRLLLATAQVCRSALRATDMMARLGGDEFAIILENSAVEAASEVSERLRRSAREITIQFGDRGYPLSFSIGIIPIDGALPAEGTIALADSALYAAKAGGKDRSVLRTEDGHAGLVVNPWRSGSKLREAIAGGRLHLAFQPIVSMATGQVDHLEALLRLRSDDGTEVPAGEVISAAERLGLAPVVDRWVLDTTLDILRQHPALSLAVNLSGQSLGDQEFTEYLEQQMTEHSELAPRLAFEITETSALVDKAGVGARVHRLKARGCRFALDDFGIGFSSFEYLKHLPIDYVKLDGSFVKDIATESQGRLLVQAMVAGAKVLGLKVVAEWVEDDKSAEVLRQLGVEYGQGYFWGRPSANPGGLGHWDPPASARRPT